jgi:pyruvate/oxaloacetate carboxyltransferase
VLFRSEIRRNISDDFRDFLAGLYGSPPDELSEEIELFNTLLAEAEAEEYST